jgi:hypothetical protein
MQAANGRSAARDLQPVGELAALARVLLGRAVFLVAQRGCWLRLWSASVISKSPPACRRFHVVQGVNHIGDLTNGSYGVPRMVWISRRAVTPPTPLAQAIAHHGRSSITSIFNHPAESLA